MEEEKEMKVYVVSEGSYDYWSIEGIFSSRENAEAFMKKWVPDNGNPKDYYNDIDEHEIDPKEPEGHK